MKKIAVVFNGDLSINRQGQLNSAISRIKHLQQQGMFEVDAYCIQEYSVGLLRWIHRKKLPKKQHIVVADGINIRVIYKPCFFISVILESRLNIGSVVSRWLFWFLSKQFKNYNLISGHSIIGGRVGLVASKRYGIPYCVTWHGSDIHTLPIHNQLLKRMVAGIIANASGNIFVSKSLYETGLVNFKQIPYPRVLYNAANDSFYKYDTVKRQELRRKWSVEGRKVVAFVGNLVEVKNVLKLPSIFKYIYSRFPDTAFWIIGDGYQRLELQNKMEKEKIYCRYWGNQQPENIPDLMNCIDVLVLPSKNESFGMVLVEAIACGANAVGSKTGGIPEVIGAENVFDLNNNFEFAISERICKLLSAHEQQKTKTIFSWVDTAKKEVDIYAEILNKQ